MRAAALSIVTLLGSLAALPASAQSPEACTLSGPQAPRDITAKVGTNTRGFPLAGSVSGMNLCNLHFHNAAEHKGPAFKVVAPASSAAKGEHGGGAGFACNDASKLTAAELKPANGACKGLKPGDTVEVHWVYSSCPVKPGKGLGSCMTSTCSNPTLRVESQVFIVVNDKSALDFASFDYAGSAGPNGLHQAKALPQGSPVVFRGSTTGPDYDSAKNCSPVKATWSVRPTCAKLDINTLHKWCAENAFGEDHGHGVRPLVTTPGLLDTIP